MTKKTYYHVTTKNRLKNILKSGLKRKNRHNVPLSKDVVYVMDDLLSAGFFASEMNWKMKGDVIILHLRLDDSKIREDKNPLSLDTWKEYHGNIPPSAIVKVTDYDKEFIKKHQKRMNKRFK